MNSETIQLIGVVCLVTAAGGVGVSVLGVGITGVKGKWAVAALFVLGASCFFLGPRLVENSTGFRVTDVDVRWDQTQGNACQGTLRYTVSIETHGGEGEVWYRVIRDGQESQPKTLTVSKAGTHAAVGEIRFAYTPLHPPPHRSTIKIETLDPTDKVSDGSVMTLRCNESDAATIASIDQFFSDYYDAVHRYARDSSAVTSVFYVYPLTWYSRSFPTEDAFVCYIRRCQLGGTAPPSPQAAAGQNTCVFDPVRVQQIVSDNGESLDIDASVDWHKGTHTGQTFLDYTLDRADGQQPFRIASVTQPRASETCS